jgi:hypothetical protein
MFEERDDVVQIGVLESAERRHRGARNTLTNDVFDLGVGFRVPHKIRAASSQTAKSVAKRAVTAVKSLSVVHRWT